MVRVAAQRRARRVPRSGTPWVPRRSALGGAVLRRRQAVSNHPCTNRVFLFLLSFRWKFQNHVTSTWSPAPYYSTISSEKPR